MIPEPARAALAAKSPHNILHLISRQGDGDEKYASAGRELRRWIEAGIVRCDGERALYRYHQVFNASGREYVRKGFVCRVWLHRFEEGVVLPHERTLSGSKIDRLKLTRPPPSDARQTACCTSSGASPIRTGQVDGANLRSAPCRSWLLRPRR